MHIFQNHFALPLGDNPIALNKYYYYYIILEPRLNDIIFLLFQSHSPVNAMAGNQTLQTWNVAHDTMLTCSIMKISHLD